MNLLSIYGTTEVCSFILPVGPSHLTGFQTGGLLNSSRDMAVDKDWNWLRATGLILDYLVMEPRGDNTFEAVINDGYPPKVVRNRMFSCLSLI